MKDISRKELEILLDSNGQSHLLQFWDHLSKEDQTIFIKELNCIQYDGIDGMFKQALKDLETTKKLLDHAMEPILAEDLGSFRHSSQQALVDYRKIGLNNIKEGKIAVILMAGGVGTRLGVNYPKGMYDVGLNSHKSLYQLQAERIKKLNELSQEGDSNSPNKIRNNGLFWCIMTSDNTIDETSLYFKKNNFFGLNPNTILFFKQHSIPCLDMQGKIILESTNKISLSPEGNGGIYKALLTSGVLSNLIERGINYVHVYGVDNILVKVADPIFMGFCIKRQAECGVKVIEKTDPNEAVGVVCKVEGKYQVVEYSEISYDTAHKMNPEGQLVYNAGNIANHFFQLNFCSMYHENLMYHVAKKKIPYINNRGEKIVPEKPNGVKLEKFIFDVFPLAKKFAVWQAERDEEFSPLKNADSAKDSTPTTCRLSLYNLHQKYIKKAGGSFVKTDNIEAACEISPLVSYDGEGLENIVKGQIYSIPFLLSSENEEIPSIITQAMPQELQEFDKMTLHQNSVGLVYN